MDSLNPTKIGRKTVPNTGVYEDDGQVVDLKISSYYSENPRIEAIVNATEEEDPELLKKLVKEHEKIINESETKGKSYEGIN